MQRAVADFLRAAGLSLNDPQLKQTPERVAQAFADGFLEGYQRTPEEALGELYPAAPDNTGELVVLSDIQFSSMCPHHLLPYFGKAHLAYVVADKLVGFGRLVCLVECFAHRLTLQEELASRVAKLLSVTLGSPGTACIIEGRHLCLKSHRVRQSEARAHVESYQGVLRTDRVLRRHLWNRIGAVDAKR